MARNDLKINVYEIENECKSNEILDRRKTTEKFEMASEIRGIQPIPDCTFGNISVIMTTSIENAFYR